MNGVRLDKCNEWVGLDKCNEWVGLDECNERSKVGWM